MSFYTFEHIPRAQHAVLFEKIAGWLKPSGLFLFCLEAGEVDDVVSEWLGTPMFFSCFDPETTRGLVRTAGFEIVEFAIEVQHEAGTEIPYHWVLARKTG